MYSAHISIRYGKACHRTNCTLLFHGKMEKICTRRRKAREISRGQRRKEGMAQASRTRGTHGNRTGKNQRGEAADQLELRSVRQPWPCLLLERRAACAQPARSLSEFGSPPAPSRPRSACIADLRVWVPAAGVLSSAIAAAARLSDRPWRTAAIASRVADRRRLRN